MAKFLDSRCFNGTVYKMIETPNGLIINGHYYDKTTMSPEPLNTLDIRGASNRLWTDMSAVIEYPGSGIDGARIKNTTGSVVAVNNNNPAQFLMICPQDETATTPTMNLTLFEEKDKTLKTIKSTTFNLSLYSNSYAYYGMPMKVLEQNDDYFYVTFQSEYQGSFSDTYIRNGHLLAINKKTLDVTNVYNSTSRNVVIELLYKEGSILYLMIKYGETNVVVAKVVGTTITLSTAKVLTEGHFNYRYSIPYIKNSKCYCHFFTKDASNVTTLTWDPATTDLNSFTLTTAAVNLNGNTILSVDSYYITNFVYKSTFLGNDYINLARYNPNYNGFSADGQGVYSFRLLDDGSLAFQNFTKFSALATKAFIYSNDRSFAVAGNKDSLVLLGFDDTIKGYKITDVLNISPVNIGFDKNDNLWVIDSSNCLHTFSLKVPTSVNLSFKEASYQYDGSDIATSILVDALNYNGDRVAVNLELSILGDALFTSNNSKVLTDATLTTAAKEIPITIKGSGNISIYPKLLLS